MFESIFDTLFNPISFFKKKDIGPSLSDTLLSLGLNTLVIVAGSMPVVRYLFLPLNKFEVPLVVATLFLIYVFLSVGLYLLFLNPLDNIKFARKLLFTFVPLMFVPISLVFLSFSNMLFKSIGVALLIGIFVWTFILEKMVLISNKLTKKSWRHFLIKISKDAIVIAWIVKFVK